MKKHNFFILLLLIPVLSLAQDQNYVKRTVYKVPTENGITEKGTGNTITAEQKSIIITFFDGIGRVVQEKKVMASSTGRDIITHFEYDGLGRQPKEFLPYTGQGTSLAYSSSAASDQLLYYSNPTPLLTGNPAANLEAVNNPYSQKFFENSPQEIVRKIAAPGNAWAGNQNNDSDHTIKYSHQVNHASEVRLYTAQVELSGTTNLYEPTFVPGTYYPEYELYKTVTRDENWTSGTANTTEEFKDKEGKVVLKRTYGDSMVNGTLENNVAHDTYYVYDQFGNLSFVLPPLVNFEAPITETVLNGLCYRYKYDDKNRLAEKKLPGKQWEFIVYDKLNRIAATGPSLSPFTNYPENDKSGWLVTKYDAFNRPILTGWVYVTGGISSAIRRSRQSDYSNPTTIVNESRSTGSTWIGGMQFQYTNVALPVADFFPLTVNYYDNYSYPEAPTVPASVQGQNVFYNDTKKPIGMQTGNVTRLLETSAGYANKENNHTFYDFKGREILSRHTNFMGGYTQTENIFDFSGKTLNTVTRHKRSYFDAIPELVTTESFTYSGQDRLLLHTHTIGSGTPELMTYHHYNELGQSIRQMVGGQVLTGDEGYQKVDFNYNARGWLKEINKIENNQDANDFFNFRLYYDDDNLYNGNVAATAWRTANDNRLRKYLYYYDAMNRLLEAEYQKVDTQVWERANSYGERIAYDKNGNIRRLWRNGEFDDINYAMEIDNLIYNYHPNSNYISEIVDDSDHPKGFSDFPAGDTEYTYDANGNMTYDDNKMIVEIRYNHLNLPVKITFGSNSTIEYVYNAMGVKFKKIVTMGANVKFTEYIDGYQYTDFVLNFFPTAAGYVKHTTTQRSNNFNYVYTYKDHLGNVRITYGKDPQTSIVKIMEEDNYYPFGLKHMNYNMSKRQYSAVNSGVLLVPCIDCTEPNKYKYNGKEFQDELGLNVYDMDARNYMPDIGRWGVMDELSEMFYNQSPYSFANNNPSMFSDPSGLAPVGSNVASTFIDETGKVKEHRDDGDDNVYLVDDEWEKGGSKSGLVAVGKEKPGMLYIPGFTYRLNDNLELEGFDDLLSLPKASGAITPVGGVFDIFGFWEVFFDKLFETTGIYDNESTALAAFVITKGKSKPWINRKLYKLLSVNLQKKFVSALENGIVSPTGRQGIIKLTETEVKAVGGAYTHKLKILGKGGDLRIYGNQLPNGQFVFSKILGH